MTSTYVNATTQGVKQAFKKLETKRRRQSIKVVRGPQMAADERDRDDADSKCVRV
jgi:hypothetical protein